MNSILEKKEISLEHLANLDLYKTEKPFYLAQLPGFETEEITNLKYEQSNGITIHDVRAHEKNFNLDEHSFTFEHFPSSVDYNKTEDSDVKYMREAVEFVRTRFSADRVICYDIRRRLNVPMSREQKASNDRSLPAPAVTAIHIDHTRLGGFHRIKRHLTLEEEETYLSGLYRARIINIWRPLFRKISNAPLAFCDARTLSEEDLVEADRVSPEYAGEIYYVRPSAKQKWYWLSNQSPDEIAIFLSFDSQRTSLSEPINYCAHGSFTDPTAPSGPPRESIEVRLVVFTKN